jgi:hypothetical protein
MTDSKPATSSEQLSSKSAEEPWQQDQLAAKKEWDIEDVRNETLDDVEITATTAHDIEKVSSHQTHHSKKSEIDPFAEPPDGGLNAWLKVFGCFLIYSNIWYGFPHPLLLSPAFLSDFKKHYC